MRLNIRDMLSVNILALSCVSDSRCLTSVQLSVNQDELRQAVSTIPPQNLGGVSGYRIGVGVAIAQVEATFLSTSLVPIYD